MSGMRSLLDLTPDELSAWLAEQGEPGYRARQIEAWLARGVLDPTAMTDLPKRLRAQLEAEFSPPLRRVARSDASDGVRKYAFELQTGANAGRRIEAVWIPERDRGTVCVSTQVGCVYRCPFCHTGTLGFGGNLRASEIIAQVLHIKRDLVEDPPERPWRGEVTHVVFMGMGEPLANFEAVCRSIAWLLEKLRISRRRITVSTSGLVPQIRRLGERVPVNLAISLHAVTDALRNKLVPVNRTWPLARLRAALDAFPLGKQRHITLEYVLLDGINDRDEDIEALIAFANPERERVNLIPFNPWPGAPYAPTPMRRAERIVGRLLAANIRATIRKPRGQEIEAACGQLAGVA